MRATLYLIQGDSWGWPPWARRAAARPIFVIMNSPRPGPRGRGRAEAEAREGHPPADEDRQRGRAVEQGRVGVAAAAEVQAVGVHRGVGLGVLGRGVLGDRED